MLNQEPLTTTITGRGDVLRYQPIYEANIIPEFLPIQLSDIKSVGYSANPCLISRCSWATIFFLSTCNIISPIQLRQIHMLSLSPYTCTCPTYVCPMAYIVEGGTS